MIEAIKTALQGLLASFVRTVIPIVVTLVVAGLVRIGLPVDEELNLAIVNFVSAILGGLSGALYYLVVRILEKTYPWASKLLGSSQAPVAYAPTKEVVDNEVVAVPLEEVKATSETKKAIVAAE